MHISISKEGYETITEEGLREEIDEAFKLFTTRIPTERRRTIMYTGTGGMDLFEETIDNSIGYIRVPIGRKVPGFLHVLKITIKKNHSGKYYKLQKA